MKIEYQAGGTTSRLIITSSLLQCRSHLLVVDELLFYFPRMKVTQHGFFLITTILEGEHAHAMRARAIAARIMEERQIRGKKQWRI
ncbi:hypothetical protein DXW21_06955 [Salmonella enterica]|uniref:Uncharacterized protein n=1 Tax=Salmonella enterica TaxID=28901 RepID=A0A5T2QU02_SALER|nr:hypothetical protein [Salmonella enterica]EAC2152226.1 hypothetical protein [Salmonella enterica subsp. enterica]EAM4339225.1 hypothetical protein [Salmonella enterica subsp. enterica serovar Minnesota]EAN3245740.1 hypothetical protein [Salmonella enterica subsp. enterica serovar Give]EBH7933217.1 hypothetical protein [Salmonella enterica subsp. enterica serovar Rubislaw]EDA1630828.1 hypothetical protein [Salmonella enterica subsp. enterica serovar Saintpaul]EDA2588446.1 hypothetical prote